MNINEPPDPRASMWAWMAYSLRFHRMQRGLSGDALARLLNCARSSISRLENGEAKLTDRQAEKIDDTWNTGRLFTTMLMYARIGHEPNWLKTFTEYEARASMIHMYSGQLIPALFQTAAYARALLQAGRWPDIDGAVQTRLARQELLDRSSPPDLWILLAESALDWPVGGAPVMREQLGRLLELSDLPHVTLRAVPRSAGAHEGLDGSFKVITVKEGQIGFIEAPNGGRLVMETAEVQSLRLRFDRIGAVALPVDSSRDLIKQIMESMA